MQTKANARKIIKDTPLAEVILRKYEMPYEADERALLRKLCLSIGLLQPGDSRDVIVDVLHVLLLAGRTRETLDSETIRKRVIELRRKNGLLTTGTASSNIRRQIKRLRDLAIAEKIKNRYRIVEFGPLQTAFDEKIVSYIIPSIISRIKEYYKAIDKRFY